MLLLDGKDVCIEPEVPKHVAYEEGCNMCNLVW
jgi:hypothetical protein